MQKIVYQKVKERIKEHGEFYKIDELCLDQIHIMEFTPQLSKLIQKCKNIEYLTFNDCALTSLLNFPKLQKLNALQMSSNSRLGDESLEQLWGKQSLKSFIVQDNKLYSASSLNSFKSLEQLSVKGNPFYPKQNSEECQSIRKQLFQTLPSLRLINNINRIGKFEEDNSEQSEQESQLDESDEENESNGQQSHQNIEQQPGKFRKVNE